MTASTAHAADVIINAQLHAYDTLCDLSVSPQLLQTLVLKKDSSFTAIDCHALQGLVENPHAVLISITNKSMIDIEITIKDLQDIVLIRKNNRNVIPIAIGGKSKKDDTYEAIFMSDFKGVWGIPVSKGAQIDLLAFFEEGLDGDLIKIGKYKPVVIVPYTKKIPYNAKDTVDVISKKVDINLVEVKASKIEAYPNPYADKELTGIIIEIKCTAQEAEVVLNESSIYARYQSGKLVTETVVFDCRNFNEISPSMLFGGYSTVRKWNIIVGDKLYDYGNSIMSFPMILEKDGTGLNYTLKQGDTIRVGFVLPAKPKDIDSVFVLGKEFEISKEGKK
jgi:hypothetical protein